MKLIFKLKLNKSLPIENETDKTKLLKLKLDRYNNIICITEVPDDFTKIIKGSRTHSYLKETILKRRNDQLFIQLKDTYRISKIIYRFQNSKGELLDQISFD